MDDADFRRIAEASTDRFRLEALQTYLVPEEVEELEAWRRGHRTLPDVDDSPWLQTIRDTTTRGVRWWRVRVLDYPLTEYTEFELHGYQGNAAAGEQVYIANRTWAPELTDLQEDFWVFDHQVVIRMIYDESGHFVRPEQVSGGIGHYLELRSTALRRAVPLADYLAHNEPRLIA